MNTDHFIVADLKERGWTDALIRDLLGEPDATRQNPYYRSGPPMRLYLQERVIAAEQTEKWFTHIAKAEARRATAQKAFDTKLTKLIAKVESEEITAPLMPMETLIRLAYESYNEFRSAKAARHGSGWDDVTPESEPQHVQRRVVNYLRHEWTKYEAELARLHGRVGKRVATHLVRRKVYAAIATTYPDLAEECQRQMESRSKSDE